MILPAPIDPPRNAPANNEPLERFDIDAAIADPTRIRRRRHGLRPLVAGATPTSVAVEWDYQDGRTYPPVLYTARGDLKGNYSFGDLALVVKS